LREMAFGRERGSLSGNASDPSTTPGQARLLRMTDCF
jgi:hypothetical protein